MRRREEHILWTVVLVAPVLIGCLPPTSTAPIWQVLLDCAALAMGCVAAFRLARFSGKPVYSWCAFVCYLLAIIGITASDFRGFDLGYLWRR